MRDTLARSARHKVALLDAGVMYFPGVNRRAFLSLLGAVAVAPTAGRAQPRPAVARVGVLGERAPEDPFIEAFRRSLQELGYREGQTLVLEYRYARGAVDRFPELAGELLRLKLDVLVVGGTIAARAARTHGSAVPIVFVVAGDPVGAGLAASLARPGGNLTGLTNLSPGLLPKQLELLREAVPKLSRLSVIFNPANPSNEPALHEVRAAANSMGVELQVLPVRRPSDLAGAFAALARWKTGGVLAVSDPTLGSQLAEIARRAAALRLPAMYSRKEFVEVGGLIAYGPSFEENYRRAARYVDKILRGAKAGDLPIEQPTRFELAANLKTAKALDLTIPPALLARADRVVE